MMAVFSFFSSEVFATSAPSVIEAKLMIDNPCKGLKHKIGFITIAIDKLERLEVNNITISVIKDEGEFFASGKLDCKTSSSAVLKSSAGIDISINANFNLNKCSNMHVKLQLSNIRGDAGQILAPFIRSQSDALSLKIKERLIAHCDTMVTL